MVVEQVLLLSLTAQRLHLRCSHRPTLPADHTAVRVGKNKRKWWGSCGDEPPLVARNSVQQTTLTASRYYSPRSHVACEHRPAQPLMAINLSSRSVSAS